MQLFPQTSHLTAGKLLLIVCLLFSITIIGGSPTFIHYEHDQKRVVDSCRFKNKMKLNELEVKLNQYELNKKVPDR